MEARTLRGLAGLTCLAVLVVACGSSADGGGTGTGTDGSPAGDETAAGDGEPITIGNIVDLTGSLEGFNENAVPGYDYALAAFNEQGGINGAPIELEREDTGSQNEQAPVLMRKIAGGESVVVLGPFSTTMLIAAAPVAGQMGIPVIGPTSIGRWDGEFNDYTFRLSPTLETVLPEYVREVQEAWDLQSMGVIYDQENDASATEAAILETLIPELGMEHAGQEAHRTGDTDFSAQITNLMSANPDAIWVGSIDDEANLIMQQLRERGYEGEFISSSTINDPGILERSGGAALGIVTYQTVDVAGDDPELVALVDRYEQDHGTRNMPGLIATTYAAFQAAADAIARAEDPRDRESIREALAQTTDLETVIGKVTWNGSGDNQNAIYYPYQLVEPGEFVPFDGAKHDEL